MMNTTTNKATKRFTPEELDAMAKRSIERRGHRPTYVAAGPACMVCEFSSEAEARACANDFAKHAATRVEHDDELGWLCEIDICG